MENSFYSQLHAVSGVESVWILERGSLRYSLSHSLSALRRGTGVGGRPSRLGLAIELFEPIVSFEA